MSAGQLLRERDERRRIVGDNFSRPGDRFINFATDVYRPFIYLRSYIHERGIDALGKGRGDVGILICVYYSVSLELDYIAIALK